MKLFGSGLGRICGVAAASTAREMAKLVRLAVQETPTVELRLDWLQDDSERKKLLAWLLRSDWKGTTLLVTCRRKMGGGEFEGDAGAELQDRYGPPPPPVRNLLDYASLKLLCMRVGVNAIERKRDSVTFKFRQNAAVDPEQLARFVSAQRGAQFTPDGMLKFVLKATAADEVLRALRTVLEQLASEESASDVRSEATEKHS